MEDIPKPTTDIITYCDSGTPGHLLVITGTYACSYVVSYLPRALNNSSILFT